MRTKNNGSRFIEQYEWTIGVCITLQIGERGTFTDVQIGERGKQRVNKLRSVNLLGKPPNPVSFQITFIQNPDNFFSHELCLLAWIETPNFASFYM